MPAQLPAAAAARPASTATCRIGARGVSRSFGPVRANTDVTLEVRPGTVHAVVGENGAGKSTLMKMLYGLDQPDNGTVVIDDEDVTLSGPREAIARGIGLVQQELAIIPGLTLLENLVLDAEPTRGPSIDWGSARETADRLSAGGGVEIDWTSDAATTSVAVSQQVEILRLVHRGADVLILDEPTASLAPAQAAELLDLLRELRSNSRTIVFISHKLDEVVHIADRITVLRAGRTIGEYERGEVDRDGLAALIMGDAATPEADEERSRRAPGDVVLSVSGLHCDDDRAIERVTGVDLDVRAGEILGVAAVAGNGQEELAEALIGIRTPSSGQITVAGREVSRASVRKRRQLGLSYVSADRKHEGLALDLPITMNAIAGPKLSGLATRGWLGRRRTKAEGQAVLERADVRYGSAEDPVSALSGGNQQRVVLGRETIGDVTVLIASQPTRGVDVRGIEQIHELLRRARDEGSAIVLFSEELDELLKLSDRLVVLHRGTVAGELPAGASRSEVGALMLGSGQGHAEDEPMS